MNAMRVLAVLSFLFAGPAQAQFYAGLEVVSAKFGRVGDSNGFIARKLASEGIAASQTDRNRDIEASPVVGYRIKDFGVEFGIRRFEWTSRIDARAGSTFIVSSETGARTAVTNVRFASLATTSADALTVGMTWTPRLWENGELYTKIGVAYMDICSHVLEASDADGRTPKHVESKAGFCRSDGRPEETRLYESHKLFALGYTHKFRGWRVTGYVESIDDVGSYGTAFVDGGGVGDQSLYLVGLRLSMVFGN